MVNVEAGGSFETSLNMYSIIFCGTAEDSNFHIHRSEKHPFKTNVAALVTPLQRVVQRIRRVGVKIVRRILSLSSFWFRLCSSESRSKNAIGFSGP
jgi:hypothetical protein